ncbi:thiol-disulfide oxidoreductase DCC family protein [Streptomyces albidochromogenes]|uniref:Thiol-disulfide oxidoreductase DCC family protein n=1 Tax=Streptomyces albidochromogenes TaxID=329524 RepID=A0ABW6FIX2_9ACTN
MSRLPVSRLTILYDAQCSLCVHLRNWLLRQRKLVPLDLVPARSVEARRRFPVLDHDRTLREITVIGDKGQVYGGLAAWVVCLWALAEYRPKAHWLATPAGAPFVRMTMLAAAKYRDARTAGAGVPVPCDDRCAAPR